MPALIFNKVIESLSGSDIKLIGVFVLTASLYQTLGLTFGFITKLLTPAPRYWTGGLIVASSMSNIGDLPIAYVTTLASGTLFGSSGAARGTAYSVIFLSVFIFTFFNIGGYRLIQHDFTKRVKDIEANKYSKTQKNEPGIKHLYSVACEAYQKLRKRNTQPVQISAPVPTLPIPPPRVPKRVVIQDDRTMLGLRPNSLDDPRLSKVPTATMSLNDAASVASEPAPVERFHTTGSIALNPHLWRYTSSSSLRGPFIPGAGALPTDALYEDDEDERSDKLPEAEGIDNLISAYSQTDRLQRVLSRHDTRPSTPPTPIDDKDTKSIKKKRWSLKRYLHKHNLGFVWEFLANFLRPPSMALIIAMTFTMIPWVRRLFYADPSKGDYGIPNAPDGQPPLSFVMDITAFVGNCEVPLGLATLGATIARLQLGSMPRGFWQTVGLMTLFKLVVLPIIAVAWTQKMTRLGWIAGDNHIAIFVMVISAGLPSATSQVYLTAIYTRKDADEHEEMDCLAACLICQYAFLLLTMTILLTYTLKNVLEM